jgi:hypothetical protein
MAAPESAALDIAISFDVTGSMMPVLATVRENLERLTATIFAGQGRDVRMEVIAHGDYDSRPYQIMSTNGFTRDPAEVAAFIRSVRAVTNDWNEGEAYELVLERCKGLAWRPEAKKLLVLVGDDLPHPPHFPQNAARLDWEAAARYLAEMDVCIYAVQCASSMPLARARPFYEKLASFHRRSRHVQLDQFYMMPELVLGIFHAASDDLGALAEHEARLAREGRRTRGMARTFAALRGEAAEGGEAEEPPTSIGILRTDPSGANAADADPEPGSPLAAVAAAFAADAAFASPPGLGSAATPTSALAPLPPGRFQAMPVPADCSIRSFVEGMGIRFRAGRGFYELTKTEEVSARKEVVLERRADGDMFTGDAALRLLGVPAGGKARVSPAHPASSAFRIFVQSTSYNRRLLGGTRFLYELD